MVQKEIQKVKRKNQEKFMILKKVASILATFFSIYTNVKNHPRYKDFHFKSL